VLTHIPLPHPAMNRPMNHDVQLKRLATFSDHPNPAVTRILFTPNDMTARRYGT